MTPILAAMALAAAPAAEPPGAAFDGRCTTTSVLERESPGHALIRTPIACHGLILSAPQGSDRTNRLYMFAVDAPKGSAIAFGGDRTRPDVIELHTIYPGAATPLAVGQGDCRAFSKAGELVAVTCFARSRREAYLVDFKPAPGQRWPAPGV